MAINNQEHTTDLATFGFWIYLMSDCLIFATLFAAYAVLQTQTYGGPSGKDIFDLRFVLAETFILLTSSFTMGLSMLATYRKRKRSALVALFVTFVLGATFLFLEISEFRHLALSGFSWQRSAFLSTFFTLVGTHGTHVFFGMVWMIILGARIALRGITPSSARKLMCLSLFWHFLDIVWIFIFTFVYLFGIVV